MITSAEHFNRAVTLWFELIGMDPEWDGYGRAAIGDFQMKRTNDEIKESMKLDPTCVTAYMLLEAVSKSYFTNKTFSAADIDADEDAMFAYMAKLREFKKLIKDPDINAAVGSYKEALRKALVHIGCDGTMIGKFLENNARVAYIRLDALISANRLRADQFLSGDLDPEIVKPLYNPEMFSYWNVNSMIEHICSMPSGMSLNLVRDPDELHSYFAIAIRNGGNVMILTDVPEYAHPFGRDMSRRPDRAMDSRAGQNWFPYDKLQIAYNEKGDPYHDKYRETVERGLVPHQPEFFAFAKLSELDIRCAAWLVQVFDKIVEKYWKAPWPQRQLSYTAEMMRLDDETKVLAAAVNANLPVTTYEPLRLKPLTVDDVMTDALDTKALGRKAGDGSGRDQSYGRNRWMEERYGKLVPNGALNVLTIGNANVPLLANKPIKPAGRQFFKPIEDGQALAVIRDDIQMVPAKLAKDIGGSFGVQLEEGTRVYPLRGVDATAFGTREKIDADRKFIARSNFARAIQLEADNEFVKERPAILKWFEDKVKKNIDFISSFACFEVGEITERVRPSLPRAFDKDEDDVNAREDEIHTGFERYAFSGLIDMDAKHDIWDWGYMSNSQVVLSNGWTQSRGGAYLCYFDDTRSTYALQLRPGCSADLALLTGVAEEDLPFFLKQWNPALDDGYHGNTILDRIDPLEWRLQNPWHQMDFGVRIALSKRALARIRKTMIKPPLPDLGKARHNLTIIQSGGHGNASQVEHYNFRQYDDEGNEKSRR